MSRRLLRQLFVARNLQKNIYSAQYLQRQTLYSQLRYARLYATAKDQSDGAQETKSEETEKSSEEETSKSEGDSPPPPPPPPPSSQRTDRLRTFLDFVIFGAVGWTGYAWYKQYTAESTHTIRIPFPETAPDGTVRTVEKEVEMLTPQQVTKVLRGNEVSYLVKRGAAKNPIKRYDVNSLPSNNPIEDDRCEVILQSENAASPSTTGDIAFFGVFDGHGGWNTSKLLSGDLAPWVARELDRAYKKEGKEYRRLGGRTDQRAVEFAIKKAFQDLDNDIVFGSVERLFKESKKAGGGAADRSLATKYVLPAVSGACALLAYIDGASNDLYVACTGDSRAIIGRKDPISGQWVPIQMSQDQTGRSMQEKERIQKEHPGEESTVIANGRVLGGLEPTRAFGDSRYKWPFKLQEEIATRFALGRSSPPRNFKTPPYVTARPEVQHRKLDVEGGDSFMVMATDGLWDELTSDEVVALVGNHLDGKRNTTLRSSEILKSSAQSAQDKSPRSLSSDRMFVFEDENLSTHLIRNAIGGANRDKVVSLLSIPLGMVRRYKDDITATVIVFGDDPAAPEGISLNEIASAPKEAKL